MNTHNDDPNFVTSPLMSPLYEFKKSLDDIWEKKRITNNGEYHREMEKALANWLGVPCISLFIYCLFIPWDDDIDIRMPRTDYKKFICTPLKNYATHKPV